MKHTKEQLEAMSDFELNTIVVKFDKTRFLDKLTNTSMVAKGKVNYCKNWSDIGPLMEECGISVIKVSDGYLAIGEWGYIDINSCETMLQIEQTGNQNESVNTNLKRAIAIVYILIKQGE